MISVSFVRTSRYIFLEIIRKTTVSFIFNMAQTWILQKTGQKIILTVRRELYIHIQSLSSRFFDLTPVGKLVTRVTNDVEALNEMYSGILVRLFRNIVKIKMY